MQDTVVSVIVGILRDANNRVFIAKRPKDTHCGGYWEFPGGKIEADESPFAALQRELLEELAINVHDAKPLMKHRHTYPELSVELDIWEVIRYSGQPYGAEHQETRWVAISELNQYPFPAANRPIIESL